MPIITWISGALAATLILVPTLSPAWTPYGYAPYGPGYDQFDRTPAPPDTRFQNPAATPPYPIGPAPGRQAFGPGYQPYRPGHPRAWTAYDQAGSEGFQPQPAQPPNPSRSPLGAPARERPRLQGQPRFQISRDLTQDSYILDIRLDGMAPGELQVDTQGHWIRLGRNETREQVQEESLDDGRGYMRSYSYSTGITRQRFRLPQDADPSAMSRVDGEDSVRITVPRVRP